MSCGEPPPTTTGSIARALERAGVVVELVGSADVGIAMFEAAERAGRGAITFFRSERYASAWRTGEASAALVPRALIRAFHPEGATLASRTLLVVDDVDVASVHVLPLFSVPAAPRMPGIHAGAVVDPSAMLGADVVVGPHCVVGAGARVGTGSTLVARVFVGAGATIGERALLHPGVTVLDRCRVGNGCILHAGVVIGADGFGFAATRAGLVKIPHIGDVVIEDDVEIGANTCVDRAKFGSTLIGRGTKIDNLVQIAHNCRVGRSCVVCGQSSLAGSVVLGDGVVLGGSVGVADGCEIGSGSRVAAFAGVHANIPANSEYMGVPAGPARNWRRTYAILGSLHEHLSQIRKAIRGQAPLP